MKNTVVRTCDSIRERLIYLNGTEGHTFRKIALMDEFIPVPPGTLCAISKGDKVPERWRTHLGMAATGTVYLIGDGEIPPGAQVITGNFGVCACGMPFYKNHPVRKRCFICSPYKKLIK